MRTLTRIENLSNIVAWSRDTKKVEINTGEAVEVRFFCFVLFFKNMFVSTLTHAFPFKREYQQ